MGHYEIRKDLKTGTWSITHCAPGWITPVGTGLKRKQAIMTARLLAGRTGKVIIR